MTGITHGSHRRRDAAIVSAVVLKRRLLLLIGIFRRSGRIANTQITTLLVLAVPPY